MELHFGHSTESTGSGRAPSAGELEDSGTDFAVGEEFRAGNPGGGGLAAGVVPPVGTADGLGALQGEGKKCKAVVDEEPGTAWLVQQQQQQLLLQLQQQQQEAREAEKWKAEVCARLEDMRGWSWKLG